MPKTREQIVLLEQRLTGYQSVRCCEPLTHVSLVRAWDLVEHRSDSARLMAALVDLWTTFIFMHLDITDFGGTWNGSFTVGKLEGGSVLDAPEKFVGKMDIHRACTAYVLRYRSFWDKWMGFIVLLMLPGRYEEFAKARSRKKSFANVLSSLPGDLSDAAKTLRDRLTEFDNTFRTPEAHGPGSLRKWTLSMQPITDNPLIELLGFWNIANITMLKLGSHLRGEHGGRRVDQESAQQGHAAGRPQAAGG